VGFLAADVGTTFAMSKFSELEEILDNPPYDGFT
jgi:hypothetical protein